MKTLLVGVNVAKVAGSDKWAVAYLSGRKMISIPLATTGDSDGGVGSEILAPLRGRCNS